MRFYLHGETDIIVSTLTLLRRIVVSKMCHFATIIIFKVKHYFSEIRAQIEAIKFLIVCSN